MTKTTSQDPVPSQTPCPHPPFPYGMYPPYEEDEINLLDLVKTVWRYKFMLVALVFLAGAGAVAFSLYLPNIYRSEAVIVPRGEERGGAGGLAALGGFGGFAGEMLGLGRSGSLEKFEAVLKSRILSRTIFEKNREVVLASLYPEEWDSENGKWLPDVKEPPTEQDVIRSLLESLSVGLPRNTGIMTVAFEHTDPAFAKRMVLWYLEGLSEALREEDLREAAANQRFLQAQADMISDVLLKEKVYALLAKEIEKETFSRAQVPYSFVILDPPIAPDPDKKVKPKRAQICILSVMVAGFMGIFLVFFIEFVKKARRESAENPQSPNGSARAVNNLDE